MPTITHVKKAQQRYAMVPVCNPDGTPKQTPVMRGDGTQKTTKRGALVFMAVTVADKTKPQPLETCDFCHQPIEVGTPYKHMTPKSGPYGGHKRSRHESCPSWQVWEYSSSLSARIAQIQHDAPSADGMDDPEDARQALSDAAEEIRALASEKEEGADNIESGFQHETYQSTELREQAEALNGWADEVEETEIPELPEPEEEDCETCGGSGHFGNDPESGVGCEDCDGTGTVTPEEPTEDQMDAWRSEVSDALSVIDNSPV